MAWREEGLRDESPAMEETHRSSEASPAAQPLPRPLPLPLREGEAGRGT